MPRFVILTHDHPILHWDLMLEAGDLLRTWRLLDLPSSASFIEAEPIGDHRTEYLDYEGPVSAGRGTVTRWDRGEYAVQLDEIDRMELQLSGRRLTGRYALIRQPGTSRWSFQSLGE